jgi:predicted sulfurtransferase
MDGSKTYSKKRSHRQQSRHDDDGNSASSNTRNCNDRDVRPEQSVSVAGKPLPPPVSSSIDGAAASAASAPSTGNAKTIGQQGSGSIVLFYQYQEPMWTTSEFSKVLKLFLQICRTHNMKGRGRVAPEGVNCTLSNSCPLAIRRFCTALRDPAVWTIPTTNSTSSSTDNTTLFGETDFKITDDVPYNQLFKSLTIRKVDELVAYGLEGPDKAPSITKFGGTHLNAIDYHEALRDPNAVVIDVRNAYETTIGTIVPPPGGATLIDPKMRNSHEWPKWLASKETQEQLHGKKILTFCTGEWLEFDLALVCCCVRRGGSAAAMVVVVDMVVAVSTPF